MGSNRPHTASYKLQIVQYEEDMEIGVLKYILNELCKGKHVKWRKCMKRKRNRGWKQEEKCSRKLAKWHWSFNKHNSYTHS